MIGIKCKIKNNVKQVGKKLETTTYLTLNHAAASLRLIAKRSIKRSKKPSSPNTPPHTSTSRLPRAIIYAVDKNKLVAVIGPSRDLIGLAGKAHETGGRFRGQVYPKRPYMAPALRQVTPKLPKLWAATFKG